MSKTTLLFLLLLWTTIGTTQDSSTHATVNSSPTQKQIDDLLDRVSSLPPEYKADLGFTIFDATMTSLSPARQQSLLEDIFHSAGRSRHPYGLTEASKRDVLATLLGYSKLDTLEIQSQAVERALPSTPQFARQLFEEMQLSKDRASCHDASVENVSAFYGAAGKIIADQRIKTVSGEGKSTYLLSLVDNASIPAEIAPLAELVSLTSMPADRLTMFGDSFVSALTRITASDREMTAAEAGGDLTRAIKLLSTRFAQSGIYPGQLLSAYRSFLVHSLTSESCADNSLNRTEVARNFNGLLPTSLATAPDLVPLTAAQLQPLAKGVSADSHTFPIVAQDPEMMAKLFRIAAAQAKRSTEEYSSGQPSTITPYVPDIDDLIKYAISLNPSGRDCPVCDFYSKGALLQALVQLFPTGSELVTAVSGEVDLLQLDDMQKNEPIAWLHIFKQLVNVSRPSDDHVKNSLTTRAKKGTLLPMDAPSTAAPEIRRILLGLNDPIIFVYMSAEDLLHLPYVVGAHY